MQSYEHRQFSAWIVAFFGVFAVVFAMCGFMGAALPARLVAFLFVAIAIAFSALVTRVDAKGVSWAFTLGFPGGSIPFADIGDVEITETNFWEGLAGIHWTIWHGWLWNVSGYRAVIVRKRGGERVTLGTDDPQGLYEAIARLRSGV